MLGVSGPTKSSIIPSHVSPAIPAAGAKTPSTNCCQSGPDRSFHAESRRAGCWELDAITDANATRYKTREVNLMGIAIVDESELFFVHAI